jgi:hypothetical protein
MTSFARFKAECKRWVDYYGLGAWEIGYKYGIDGGNSRQDGCCIWDYAAMRATLCMARGNLDSTPEEIAKHEMAELLLAEIWSVACEKKATEDVIYASRHRVINIIVRMMKQLNGGTLVPPASGVP